MLFFLYLAYPKGKRYNGPLNNKKKTCKRKPFQEKDTEGKIHGFPQKSLPSMQLPQKGAANNGPKAQTCTINGSSTQALEGESRLRVFFINLLTVIYFYT